MRELSTVSERSQNYSLIILRCAKEENHPWVSLSVIKAFPKISRCRMYASTVIKFETNKLFFFML